MNRKEKQSQSTINMTRVPTDRDVGVQNIKCWKEMQINWLDTTITLLEVISVSTPQNSDACQTGPSYTEIP